MARSGFLDSSHANSSELINPQRGQIGKENPTFLGDKAPSFQVQIFGTDLLFCIQWRADRRSFRTPRLRMLD